MRKMNKRGDEISPLQWFGIGRLLLYAIVFLIGIALIYQAVRIIYPPSDPNIIATATVAHAIEVGVNNFDSLQKNNVVAIPIPMRLDANHIISLTDNLENVGVSEIYKGGVKPEVCLYQKSLNTNTGSLLECVPLKTSGKLSRVVPFVSINSRFYDAALNVEIPITTFYVIITKLNADTTYCTEGRYGILVGDLISATGISDISAPLAAYNSASSKDVYLACKN